MAFTPAADETGLKSQRAQIMAEIQRRGGEAKAPGFAAQLQQVDAALRTVRAAPAGGGTQTPPATQQSTGPFYGDLAPKPDTINAGSKGGDIINASYDANNKQAQTGNQLSNANQNGPLGSQNVTYDPTTGQPTVTQNLSGGNQRSLDSIQGNSAKSGDVLSSLLGGGLPGQNGSGPQGVNAGGPGGPATGNPISDYENAIYTQLTNNLQKNKSNDFEQLQQTLANRGIGLGNKAANDSMDQFYSSYANQDQQAAAQAISQGNSMFNQTAGTLSGVNQSGFFAPQFQGFQATPYQQVNPLDVYNSLVNKKQGDDQNAIMKSKAGSSGGGGGGGGGLASSAPSPFISSAPPGS